MNRKMRIFIAVLGTETNSFAPMPTGLAEFSQFPLDEPLETAKHPFVSIVRAVRERASGHELVFGPAAFAMPGGTTTRRAYETLRDQLLDELRAALPLDVVMLGLHGAMIADGCEDAEGDLLARVRSIVGPDVVVGAELDPHGHLTRRKAENADLLVFFKEYPHTDMYERAIETIDLCIGAAQRRIKPVMSVFDCGMISIYHTTREPMRGFVDRMQALEGKDGVLSISLVHGFPWGDCVEYGTKVLVVTDDAKQKGDALAEKLSHELTGMRDLLLAPYLSADGALDAALAIEGHPVIIADSADNPGGGGAGDSTFILRRMIERGVTEAALGLLWDPGAVAQCFAAGDGAHLPLRIGGKTSPASGDPIDVEAEVLACVAGARMIDCYGRDETALQGDSAAIRVAGIDIVLNTFRTQARGDVFTPLGVDWRAKKIVVVKSSQHFYATYAPSAAGVFYAETPGSMTMDWTKLQFRHRPPNIWPFRDTPDGPA